MSELLENPSDSDSQGVPLDSAALFIAIAFILFFTVHFRFIYLHSYPVPYWDESDYIPYITGEQHVTLKWLWTAINGHRIPLIKVLYLCIARATGVNQFAMNAVNLGLLALTAIVFLAGVWKINGKAQLTDVIVVIALLNLGHYSNTTWPNQLAFILPSCIACILTLLLAVPFKEEATRYVCIGATIISLCVCGANGLPFGLTLAPALFWCGFRVWRAPGRRTQSLFTLACGAFVVVYCVCYFLRLKTLQFPARPFVFSEGIQESIKVGSQIFGPASADLWPYSGIVSIVLILTCTAIVGRRLSKTRLTGHTEVAFLLATVGFVGLALGVGMARTILGSGAGFAPRYGTLMTPGPLLALLIFDRYTSGKLLNLLRMAIFSLFCLLYWHNGEIAIADLNARVADGKVMELQIQQGVPIEKLADEYGARWMFRPDLFAERMHALARRRTGIYSRYAPPSMALDLMYQLSSGTEIKGPLASGTLIQMSSYRLPGALGLIAHPPHRTSIAVAQNIHRIHIGFGILPNNPTKGVDFSVLIRNADGNSRVVWSRRLDPRNVPADNGTQVADIDLPHPIVPSGRLVFATAAAREPLGCWAYWTDLQLR